jgi:nucleoid-associated protein YgaU
MRDRVAKLQQTAQDKAAAAKETVVETASDVKDTVQETVQSTAQAVAQVVSSEPEPIAEHTVVSGDTLSGIALRYYGSAARAKWMAIYEANKETIGNNPNLIRIGQKLTIPALD